MDTIKDNKLSDRKEEGFTADPFGNNKACTFAYQKAERISIAIHLITNFVPEREPIRHALRDKSIATLSDILKLRGGFRSAGSENVNKVIARLYEIASLLTVVQSSGYISKMNLSIIHAECNSLCTFFREVEDAGGSESLELAESFFGVGYDRNYSKGQKGQVSRVSQMSVSEEKDREGRVPVKVKSTSGQHSERRSTILKLLKNKSKISVKDASSVVSDCSEKTLQRELMSMVSEGILMKEGERRWSTYSVVS